MPLRIFKPKEFQNNLRFSVILPIYEGELSSNYARLISELKIQTLRDFEVIVSSRVHPNGRARNEGVKKAQGEILIFLDETTSISDPRLLEKLVRALLENPKAGAVGAATQLYPEANGIQKQYYYFSRTFDAKPVTDFKDSDRVQHGCMVIKKTVFKEVGGESNFLRTGTDNDLRQRLRNKGYAIYLVPDCVIDHVPPRKLSALLRKGLLKGQGSAYAFLQFPGLFEFASVANKPIRNPFMALGYKLASFSPKLLRPKFLFHPVALLYEGATVLGFVFGWLRWIGRKPHDKRVDLEFGEN